MTDIPGYEYLEVLLATENLKNTPEISIVSG